MTGNFISNLNIKWKAVPDGEGCDRLSAWHQSMSPGAHSSLKTTTSAITGQKQSAKKYANEYTIIIC